MITIRLGHGDYVVCRTYVADDPGKVQREVLILDDGKRRTVGEDPHDSLFEHTSEGDLRIAVRIIIDGAEGGRHLVRALEKSIEAAAQAEKEDDDV